MKNIDSASKTSFSHAQVHGNSGNVIDARQSLLARVVEESPSIGIVNSNSVREHTINETTKYEDCYQSFQRTHHLTNEIINVDEWEGKCGSDEQAKTNCDYIKTSDKSELSIIIKYNISDCKDIQANEINHKHSNNTNDIEILERSEGQLPIEPEIENLKIQDQIVETSESVGQQNGHLGKDAQPIDIDNSSQSFQYANDSLDNQVDYEAMRSRENDGAIADAGSNLANVVAVVTTTPPRRSPLAELDREECLNRTVVSRCPNYCATAAEKMLSQYMYYSTDTERSLIACLKNYHCTCHDDG